VIIGFAGKKQVGKSTAAGFLVDAGFARAPSFACPLKEMLSALLRYFGYSSDEIAYFEANKEEIIPKLGCSYRHLIQTLGADWGRNMIDSDIWVNAATPSFNVLSRAANLVIEDVRFENEAALIRGLGGRILHIESDTPYQDSHESEAGIKFMPGDATVYNNKLPGGRDVFRFTVLTLSGLGV
jgi:hypothetical protein